MLLEMIQHLENIGSIEMPKCEGIKQEHLKEAAFLYVIHITEKITKSVLESINNR